MSDTRCDHDRVTFSRTCEIRRCYDCEPLGHVATVELIEAFRQVVDAIDNETGDADLTWAREVLDAVGP